MTSSSLPKVAVDTCVLLNVLLEGELDNPAWVEHSKWVLDAHEVDHEVVLPALVLAELGGCPDVRGDHVPKAERHQRIKVVQAWLAANRYRSIDIDERVGREAARLAVIHQLKGADAAVLASASLWRIPVLFTWDRALLRVEGKVPGLMVKEPFRPTS